MIRRSSVRYDIRQPGLFKLQRRRRSHDAIEADSMVVTQCAVFVLDCQIIMYVMGGYQLASTEQKQQKCEHKRDPPGALQHCPLQLIGH